MNKFKVHDYVVCVNSDGWSTLKENGIYLITDNNISPGTAAGADGKINITLVEEYPEDFELYSKSVVAKGSKEEVDGALGIKREEYTGGSSNYYKVFVKHPTTLEAPYEAECNDIIESLKMTFAEGNAFKAIWRKAKARQGVKKKGYDNGVYDSEKVVFFGERMLVEAKDES